MANRIHSAAYYFYMARRVRGAYATDCMRQSWYRLFVDAAGAPAGVRAAPPSVASSNTERVVFKCDNHGGCRFPKQPCLASCSLTVNLATTSGVEGRKP